jgi:O-antigen/teichoic acid export membrane protein
MSASRKIFSGILHTVLGSYAGKVVNFVATIFLTRLLLPEDFGIVAIALFLASSIGLVKEFGFDFALIHRQDKVGPAGITHFFLNVVTSLIAFCLTVVLYLALTGHYDKRVLVSMLALSAIFLLRSLATTSRIMLEKDLRFSLLAWIDTTSNIITLVLGVILAFLGFGFWALVLAGSANSLVYVLVTGIRYWRSHPMSIQAGRVDRGMTRWYFSYGKWMFLCAIGTVITLQYDSFIAGTLLGVATLGFYERAYRFSQYPTDAITHVVSRVAMSIYAKYQEDEQELSRYFSLFLSMIVRVAFPLSAVIFIFADKIVLLVLGEKWLPMVPLLRWLVAYSLLRPIYDDTGAFFTAIGRPKTISIILLIQGGVMFVLAPILTYSFGVVGTAVSANVVMLIGVILAYYYVSRHIHVPYLKIFVLPCACVIIGYLCYASLLKYLFPVQSLPVHLILGIMIFLFFYSVVLLFFERDRITLFLKYFRETRT